MKTVSGSRTQVALIDLSAISDNAAVLSRRGGGLELIADLRADAYGHGLAEVAAAAIAGGARVRAVDFEGQTNLESKFLSAGTDLYGLHADPELRPAMRVSAVVVGTKIIAAGEGVSYGHTWLAQTTTSIALVGIGYADGLDRSAGNRATLSLGGSARPVIGRVAMNALVLDLGQDSAEVGDEVIVFGSPALGEPAVWQFAQSLGRPSAEVVCGFGNHLARVYR